MNKHKHHIIPRYRCKELGIDPDFPENIVEVTREDHALIHWGYKCNDLEPLFEYVTPEQWIIDFIPREDNRDIWAYNLINSDQRPSNQPTYNEKIIFRRVYREVVRFPQYCNMPLWDDDYLRELEYERCIKETKRLIEEGYEGRLREEKLQGYIWI